MGERSRRKGHRGRVRFKVMSNFSSNANCTVRCMEHDKRYGMF